MNRRRLHALLLGAGLLLLAACAAPPRRAPVPEPAPLPTTAPAQPAPTAPVEAPPVAQQSPWDRLRNRFAMNGCDYSPGVRHFIAMYTRSPRGFAASWKPALPLLALVVDELERRDLPGEFAMLPYVESTYRPVASRGNTPAGMWQLMPDTARAEGVVVRHDYDGRLDPLASTAASLELIARYQRTFEDWRLADMAFNAGEFRVRKLLGERDASTLDASALAKLRFNRITHQHLDRLLALACIVEDPQRYDVKLPEPAPDTHLRVTDLPAPMDLRLAARLARVPVDDLRQWNAAYRHDRMPDGVPHRLLLPQAQVEAFLAAADAVPPDAWNDWHEVRATRTASIDSWAGETGIAPAALAAANGIAAGTTIVPNTRLLLPGRESTRADGARVPAAREARVHVIAAGDTLSGVARRYSIPLRRLRELNPQAHGTLRLGQRLRLDTDAG